MYSIIILIFILLFGACGNNASHTFAEADRLIVEHPDSALSIMESINANDLSGEADKALYALLLTEALYRTGVDETNDSLIRVATDYYHLKDKDARRARAYYQKGMINSNAKEYGEALLSLMIAEETAMVTQDTLLLALIHRSMGDAFGRMNNPKTAIGYYEKSYDEFKIINDSVYTLDALYDLARAYHNSTDYEESICIAKEVLSECYAINDIPFAAIVIELLGDDYLSVDKNNEVINMITYLHENYPDYVSLKNWNNLGLAYLNLGNLKKAQECEDSIKAITNEQWWLSYRIADTDRNYSKALELLKVEYYDNHDIYMDWITRSAEKELLDRYAMLKEVTNKKKKEYRDKTLLLSIIITLILVIATLYFKYLQAKNRHLVSDNLNFVQQNNDLSEKRRTLSKEVKNNLETIAMFKDNLLNKENEIFCLRANLASLNHDLVKLNNVVDDLNKERNDLQCLVDDLILEIGELNKKVADFRSEMSARENAIAESREKLREAVASRFDFLDKLTKIYYEAGSGKVPRHEIAEAYLGIVNDIKNNKGLFKEFEKSVNTHLNCLMDNFRKDYPTLKQENYNLYLFSVLGFSAKTISVFMEISTETVYTRKHFLKKKIAVDLSPDSLYLEYI